MDYKEIGRVSEVLNGIPVKLILRQRDSERFSAHHVISWRTLYPGGKSNRRFYWLKKEGCWTIPCDLAVQIMEKAKEEKLIDSQYDDPYARFDGGNPEFHASNAIDNPKLFREITRDEGEPNWGSKPFFAIGVEPGKNWRKVMIVDTNCKKATFRSLTTDSSYKPIINIDNNSAWNIDNSMIDCSTEIMRFFLKELKSLIKK